MEIPSVLDGKYRIIRRVGSGNFATVYQAEDERLERTVAIKIISWDCADPVFLEMFERESRSLAALNHPNVITVHDFGECEDGPYMVLEFVEGASLEQVVNGGRLELGRSTLLARQIADGMAHVHAKGILHRDLSLNNIMVSQAGDGSEIAKVLDFGLVKMLNAATRTRGVAGLGTPSYLSPEQITGDQLDCRVDIFAFGVGLYRMLHGKFPFESEHPAAVAYLILHESNIPFDKDVPEPLKLLVSDCLEKNKDQRPNSFDVVCERLTELKIKHLASVSRSAATVPVAPYLRTSKRNPFLNRVMIKSRHDFVGRAKDVRRIYSRIDASHPQSVSIVGERRVGKSSLLNFIYDKDNRRKHMTNYDTSLFVYLDFQNIADFTVDKFVLFLCGVLELEMGESLQLGDCSGLDALREAVIQIHNEGKRIIILMDEFEVITRNEQFEEEFFSFLRSLANSYRVAYVTSSCGDLQQLCHHQDISDSPFFNIFSNLPLRAFNHDEALELIVGQSELEGLSLAKYADKIIAMTGYLPFYLQIGCSAVFEELIDAGESEVDWARIKEVFSDEATPHFEFFWNHLSVEERINLGRVADDERISRKFAFVNDDLARRGYLIMDGQGVRLASSSLAEFVKRQSTQSNSMGSWFNSLKARIRG